MYAGNFGELQDLDTVVEAARLVAHRPDILLALVGAGVTEQRLRATVERHRLTNVPLRAASAVRRVSPTFWPWPTPRSSRSRTSPSCGRRCHPSSKRTSPAAQPIIGMVSGDAADVIEGSEAGRTSPPGDAPALARSMEWFADLQEDQRNRMRFNARTAYEQKFSEKVIGDELSGTAPRGGEAECLTVDVVVVGGSGFVGTAVLEALDRRGARP